MTTPIKTEILLGSGAVTYYTSLVTEDPDNDPGASLEAILILSVLPALNFYDEPGLPVEIRALSDVSLTREM